MDNERVMQAFANGLNSHESCPSITKKRKPRRSKLQPHSVLIFKLWVTGKSMRFIKEILLSKHAISCERSTVQRFIANSISL